MNSIDQEYREAAEEMINQTEALLFKLVESVPGVFTPELLARFKRTLSSERGRKFLAFFMSQGPMSDSSDPREKKLAEILDEMSQ